MLSCGGYEYDFIPDLPLDYICVNCNLPLKKPLKISNCGHRICRSCFDHIAKDLKGNTTVQCPYDCQQTKDTEISPDTGLENELLKWDVACPNAINYCMWIGPLYKIKSHLNSCERTNAEPDFVVSKEDIQMLITKMAKMESKMKCYENDLTNCQNDLKDKNKKIEKLQKKLLSMEQQCPGTRKSDNDKSKESGQVSISSKKPQSASKEPKPKQGESKTEKETKVTRKSKQTPKRIGNIDWLPENFKLLQEANSHIVSPWFCFVPLIFIIMYYL